MAKPNVSGAPQRQLPNHADALVAYTNRLLDLLSEDNSSRPHDQRPQAPADNQRARR